MLGEDVVGRVVGRDRHAAGGEERLDAALVGDEAGEAHPAVEARRGPPAAAAPPPAGPSRRSPPRSRRRGGPAASSASTSRPTPCRGIRWPDVQDPARLPAVLGGHGHAVEPGADRDDVAGCGLGPQAEALVAAVQRRLGQLEACVRGAAADRVEPVVRAREDVVAEAVGNEVDRPVHDRVGATEPARQQAARAGEVVEAEPRVDSLGPQRDERVEHVGERRARGQPHAPLARLLAGLVDRHDVVRLLLGLERVEDRRQPPRAVLHAGSRSARTRAARGRRR